jgi:hypothetical protein
MRVVRRVHLQFGCLGEAPDLGQQRFTLHHAAERLRACFVSVGTLSVRAVMLVGGTATVVLWLSLLVLAVW